MRRPLYERQLLLAAVAALGALAVLAFGARRHAQAQLPPAEGSYSTLAASVPAAAKATPGGCNVLIGPESEGIENAVLPCGIRLYVRYRGRSVLASVIGRGPASAGTEFGLTAALARRLGLSGVRRIGWSYAGEP